MDTIGAGIAAIGNTPLVQLQKVVPEGAAEVWVKLEGGNPTGSYKDRMAISVVSAALERGDVSPGETVVVPRNDAAIIDGCNSFQVYWKVFLPNIRPALVSAGFIKFIYSWDAYIWPLIVTRDPDKAVVAIAIARLFTDQDILWEFVFAGSFLATIPVVILFLFLQRYYVQGIATTGIRG